MDPSSNNLSSPDLSLPIAAPVIPSKAIFGREHELTLRSERAAVRELSNILADERAALHRFLAVTLKACSADTAGVTLLRQPASGAPSLQWHAIAGALTAQEGFCPPRHFSSCGTCLDRAEPLLLIQPQQAFNYLGEMQPAISEMLVIPLYDGLEPLGTLWLAQHNTERSFCADDARVAERLALHLASALKQAAEAKEHSRALANRDAQLRDAHHRVKNTLQIAISSLQLDAHRTCSESARMALQMGIGRLQVLAKVHELLGREMGSEHVAVHTLLHAVVEAARHSFVELSSRVAMKLVARAVWLPADQAIPIALLANEALTNACKHAFPDGRSGAIRVELSASESTLSLRIADDGIGIADGQEPECSGAHGSARAAVRTNGLGLQLIRSFSQQLQGAVSFITPADATGTTVKLTLGCRFERLATARRLAGAEICATSL